MNQLDVGYKGTEGLQGWRRGRQGLAFAKDRRTRTAIPAAEILTQASSPVPTNCRPRATGPPGEGLETWGFGTIFFQQ